MPNKSASGSAPGSNPAAAGVSVYDFLYLDTSRINSLLAQFDPNGLLQTVRQSFSAGSASENTFSDSYGVDVKVVRAISDDARGSSVSESETGERAYDPSWLNALTLLDYLERHGFLQRQITDARIGSIVLSKGHLSVFDLPWLKEIFSDAKALQDLQSLWSKNTTITQQQKLVMRIMRLMPFPIQALLDSSGAMIWAVLNPESLLISARSLFLEYGSSLSGEWAILGTLDAIPDKKSAEKPKPASSEATTTLFDLMRQFDTLSESLGRPRMAYGITPIIIFRQVQAMSGK